ncbi:MAG: glycosyltransferase [Acidobacteriota bacterium]
MLLNVLSVAFPFAPVRADAVGGAEQILSRLDQALVRAGHSSLVVACEGSQVAGKLFSFPPPVRLGVGISEEAACRRAVQYAIDRALGSSRVDLLHMHGLDFDRYSLPEEIPAVVTLHLPIAWYPPEAWARFAGRVQFCCVSQAQRRTFPAEAGDCVVIPNGVPLPELDRQPPAGDYALVLGRVCPEKNTHAAFRAGSLAGIRVLLGGEVFPYPEHQQYFREQVAPLLEERPGLPRHAFLGPLSPSRKQRLLAGARCLLHPTRAPETSSLVAMEALAAGTPVIAFRSGALPEIVEDGVTGFLVNTAEEMAEAIRRVGSLSRQACRSAAQRRFPLQRMIAGYMDLYQTMARREPVEALYA